MQMIGRLLAGLALAALVAVLGHMALTTGARSDGAFGRFAAGTCAACH